MLNFVITCGEQNWHTALHVDRNLAVSPLVLPPELTLAKLLGYRQFLNYRRLCSHPSDCSGRVLPPTRFWRSEPSALASQTSGPLPSSCPCPAVAADFRPPAPTCLRAGTCPRLGRRAHRQMLWSHAAIALATARGQADLTQTVAEN